jgi:hypothetical protein
LSALSLLVAVDKDFEEVLVDATDTVGALFGHLDWTRAKNYRVLELMTDGLCTHSDWLVGNSGGMIVENRNGSYHSVEAPS